MRTILFTGKGGVGKTSIAAATALYSAKLGHKTLVISTDPAHSLSDSFEYTLDKKPVKIRKNLYGEEIDTQQMIEENWGVVKDYMTSLFNWEGIKEVEAEELTIFPGMEELFSLLEVKKWNDKKNFEVLILDCAPTSSTLRLLSFPEIMEWYMAHLFNIERKAMKIVRPLAMRFTSLPLPQDEVFSSIKILYHNLERMKEILVDPNRTSIRLVLNPEKMVIAESRRAFTYFNLFGLAVDAVIVNRVIPKKVEDPFFERWKVLQKNHLKEVEESFAPLPILKASLFDQEVLGFDLLLKLGKEVYGNKNPVGIFHKGPFLEITKKDSSYFLIIYLPFSKKSDFDILKKEGHLVVKVGEFKRNIFLPLSLALREPKKAQFEGNKLKIEFGGEKDG